MTPADVSLASGMPTGDAPRMADEHVLDRRRVYILPTRAGWMFAGCLATMLLGAINYNNSLAYLLTFVLASVGLVSILHTYKNQVGLRVRVARAQSVHAGELAALDLEVSNPLANERRGLMLRFDAGVASAAPASGQDISTKDVSGNGKARRVRDGCSGWQILRFDVPARDSTRISLSLATHARGWLRVAPVTLSNRYPFGLFRAWSNLDLHAQVLVYPAALGERALPAQAGAGAGEGGRVADGVEDFDGLRAYQVGDSPRRVHWKAAARSHDLPVKLLSGGGGAELSLSFDEIPGSVEQRLSQLALWLTEAEQGGHRYALRLPGFHAQVDGGPAHLHRCLTALALFGQPGTDQPGRAHT